MTHPVDREALVREAIAAHWSDVAYLSEQTEAPNPVVPMSDGLPICHARCPNRGRCSWARVVVPQVCAPAVKCLVRHMVVAERMRLDYERETSR